MVHSASRSDILSRRADPAVRHAGAPRDSVRDWNGPSEGGDAVIAATTRVPVGAAMVKPNVGVGHGLFDGPGDVRACCRAFDWASTPLGAVTGWSPSLQTTLRILFSCRHPMFLFWGPSLVQFYNDPFSASLADAAGKQGARGIGMQGAEFWANIWDIIGPQIVLIMAGGEATWHEDQMVPIERNGRREEVYWTYSYSPAFDDLGNVGGALVVCQETTARIHGERQRAGFIEALEIERARFVEMFRHAPSFIAMLRGPDLEFEFVNDAYRRLVGHRDIIGKSLFDALPELRGQGFKAVLDNVRDTGDPWVGRETPVQLQHTPGAPLETRYLDMVFQGLTDIDGTRTGMVGHGTDVTEHVLARRQIEMLLADSQVQRNDAEAARRGADEANRAKSEFLTTMSHELRTPLNAIGGYAELIAMGIYGPVTDEQSVALSRMQRSQLHLMGLIDGVLAFAKLSADAVHYKSEDVALDDVMAECDTLTEPQRVARQLHFRIEGHGNSVVARADRGQVVQCLLNLMSNAIKFSARGGTIALVAERSGEHVVVRVIDTGLGIAPEQIEHVFQPFVQVEGRLSRTHEGTGLGLAISRTLARGMGGDLTVQSELGVGSTFTLTLPATVVLPTD